MAVSQKVPFRFWAFFFSLNGRVSRGPYLAFEFPTRIVLLAAGQGLRFIPGLSTTEIGLYSLVLGLISLTVLWPNFALSFKRFHDAGTTGLWALLQFVPLFYGFYVGFARITAVMRHDMQAAQHVSSLYLAWGITILVWLVVFVAACLPGSKGVNRFGPPPGVLPGPVPDIF